MIFIRAVITVIGKDSVGIIAKVSGKCAEVCANITEITQSVLKDYFAMIMLVDIDTLKMPFSDFVDKMSDMGVENKLEIRCMHEEIFDSMHTI